MNEKGKNIILRLGSRSLECGYEGMHEPLLSVNVYHFAKPHNIQVSNQCDPDTVKEMVNFQTLFHPNILSYENEDQYLRAFESHLNRVLTKVFYKAGVPTINSKLLLITNTTLSDLYIDAIAKLLLDKFLMRAVVILATPLMSVISSGSSSAIVVDFGWDHLRVDVVYDNRVIQNYSKMTNRAGKALHYEVLKRLKSLSIDTNNVTFRDIENIIKKVENLENKQDVFIELSSFKVPKKLVVDSLTKVLFDINPRYDEDEKSVIELIVELIDKELPIDIKKSLADRIIFTGGLNCINGLTEAILEKLQSEISLKCNVIWSLGPYAGTSVYSITSKKMKKNQKLKEYRK